MYQKLVHKISDNTRRNSVSHQFRNKRFQFFLSLLQSLPKPITILDIGGTVHFWEAMDFKEPDVHIILLNLETIENLQPPFSSVKGDATNLSNFADKSVDIVFSNSVIEHLFTWENQQKMASEVQRVGKYHFIQTPNYWFPIEPHWVFPLFQYFPKTIQYWLTQQFQLGHIPRKPSYDDAKKQVDEIRLLSHKEYRILFPHSRIYCEKFAGFSKSFIAYSGEWGNLV
jgi:hypothetical protein